VVENSVEEGCTDANSVDGPLEAFCEENTSLNPLLGWTADGADSVEEKAGAGGSIEGAIAVGWNVVVGFTSGAFSIMICGVATTTGTDGFSIVTIGLSGRAGFVAVIGLVAIAGVASVIGFEAITGLGAVGAGGEAGRFGPRRTGEANL